MNTQGTGSSTELTAQSVCRLLSEGVEPPAGPVEMMLSRLRARGERAVSEALAAAGLDAGRAEQQAAGAAACAVEDAISIKDAGKAAHADAAEQGARDDAMIVYFVAVALGLVRASAMISSQPAGELSDAMSEMAGLTPEPWAGLFNTAAFLAMKPRGA